MRGAVDVVGEADDLVGELRCLHQRHQRRLAAQHESANLRAREPQETNCKQTVAKSLFGIDHQGAACERLAAPGGGGGGRPCGPGDVETRLVVGPSACEIAEADAQVATRCPDQRIVGFRFQQGFQCGQRVNQAVLVSLRQGDIEREIRIRVEQQRARERRLGRREFTAVTRSPPKPGPGIEDRRLHFGGAPVYPLRQERLAAQFMQSGLQQIRRVRPDLLRAQSVDMPARRVETTGLQQCARAVVEQARRCGRGAHRAFDGDEIGQARLRQGGLRGRRPAPEERCGHAWTRRSSHTDVNMPVIPEIVAHFSLLWTIGVGRQIVNRTGDATIPRPRAMLTA